MINGHEKGTTPEFTDMRLDMWSRPHSNGKLNGNGTHFEPRGVATVTDVITDLLQRQDRDSLRESISNKPSLREQALSGEYDPARYDSEMKYELGEGVKVPFLKEVLPMKELLLLKEQQGLEICVVVPCKNEGTKHGQEKSNIGTTLDNLQPLKEAGLVDRLWVISNSTDDTEQEARSRGVEFSRAEDMLARQGRDHKPGKGTNLNLAATEYIKSNQLLVFCDADFGVKPSQIQGVLSPLIEDPNTQMSLAWMERLTKQGNENGPSVTGGRATRFAFKPIMRTMYPELDGIQQPICGLYAARGSAVANVEFTNDYGIETALITQIADNHGAEAFAQTYCGEKSQIGQSNYKIEDMATQIANEFLDRGFKAGRRPVPVAGRTEFHIIQRPGEQKLITVEHIIYERDRLSPPALVKGVARENQSQTEPLSSQYPIYQTIN